MKYPLILIAAFALAGCEFMRTVAPQTTAGFDENGIIGALDGASGAIVAGCETIDGVQVRVAIDAVGDLANAGSTIDKVRSFRERICETADKIHAAAATE